MLLEGLVFVPFKFPHLLNVSQIELVVQKKVKNNLKMSSEFKLRLQLVHSTSISVLIALDHRFSSTTPFILSHILTSLPVPTTDVTTTVLHGRALTWIMSLALFFLDTEFCIRTEESSLCFICLICKLLTCCHVPFIRSGFLLATHTVHMLYFLTNICIRMPIRMVQFNIVL